MQTKIQKQNMLEFCRREKKKMPENLFVIKTFEIHRELLGKKVYLTRMFGAEVKSVLDLRLNCFVIGCELKPSVMPRRSSESRHSPSDCECENGF